MKVVKKKFFLGLGGLKNPEALCKGEVNGWIWGNGWWPTCCALEIAMVLFHCCVLVKDHSRVFREHWK